ncbi:MULTISPECIES: acyl carrier protein [unclassified Streptomyces]|uniref:acyl carrier protein n=1 Tax=unclassified Streptomyces TaxID=2593676 RepID=UPI00336A630E
MSPVSAHLFDCIQVNLAALAERRYGEGAGLRLGAVLRFQPSPGPDGLPTVERTVRQHLADAQGQLGLSARTISHDRPLDLIDPGPACFLVADAYYLPWVPYYRKQHIEHSFLLLARDRDTVTVEDNYFNETPWGSARPGTWHVPSGDLADLPGCAVAAELVAVPTPPADVTARRELAPPDSVDRYADAYARHPQRAVALRRLTLETWLLARSRKLHAAFLGGQAQQGQAQQGALPTAHQEQSAAWEAFTEQVYLASRRVDRGRAEPAGLTDRLAELLHADRAAFAAPPPAPAPEPDTGAGVFSERERERERRTVAEVAARVLGTDPQPLLQGASLTDVPGFSSFRVVEIIERLESELAIEFPADDLVPENLHHIDAICRIVRRSARLATSAAEPLPREETR